MKPADVTAALRREIATAQGNADKYVSRPGCDYGRFGYNLDAGIADKRSFAVSWRLWVLELAAGRQIQSRTVTVYGYGDVEVHERTYRVFSTDGQDFAAVYTRGGANCLGRYVKTPTGNVADALRADGWQVR